MTFYDYKKLISRLEHGLRHCDMNMLTSRNLKQTNTVLIPEGCRCIFAHTQYGQDLI
jgi:hypothetical protein